MFERKDAELLEEVKRDLLEYARGLCRLPESESKRLIRLNRMARRRSIGRSDQFLRDTARVLTKIIYTYRSELYRRQTGKHWYDMERHIMQRREVVSIIRLSDLVPYVVEKE